MLSRRAFLRLCGLGLLTSAAACSPTPDAQWRGLLPDYEASARRNIVYRNGRRAVLSSHLYPGTYIRDALFWGPLALDDPALGFESYQWFANTQLATGQIRTAVPLNPADAASLTPQDDEGTLLFIMAADWLHRHGHSPDFEGVLRAYQWVQTHVYEATYLSPPGAFRYWADTVQPDTLEAIAYNQGLLCLARRALLNLGIGGVGDEDVTAAQERYRGFYNAFEGYITLGKQSRFANVQDLSAVFPEFLSRYLYDEPILSDAMVTNHVRRIVRSAAVYTPEGRLAGIKTISSASGDFLPVEWFFAPGLNAPGDYQNGGYWPLYTLVALALVYHITGDIAYAGMIGQLIENELASDHQSKEIIRLTPGMIGTSEPARANYTWNALIPKACSWSGLV